MSFPTQRELELPLLQVLEDSGGHAPPKDIYPKLAQRYPQLTADDLKERMDSGNLRWANRVQWARERLKQNGELDGSVPNLWKLTDAGRARLRRGEVPLDRPTVKQRESPDLHPRLLDELSSLHSELVAKGDLRSHEALHGFYATFRQRFGPDVLSAHDGEALLSLMHETARDSLVYWLEFKDDAEFPAIFGGIAGGSALKFGLYRRRETGAWMTGTPTAQRELSTADAVAIARRNRDQLVAASSLLERFPRGAADDEYSRLQSDLASVAPDVQDTAWGRKYLALLYPEKLDDFHATAYQRFHLIKLLEQPAATEGRYVNAGRFVALADAFGWPLNHLTTVLNRRNGSPHRYWRIGTRAGDAGESHWEAMRDGSVVSIGWSKLSDLAGAIASDDFKETLRHLVTASYPGDPRLTGRSVQQIAHFCKTIAERDYVLACDGAKVLGVGRVNGSYGFSQGQGFPHRRSVEWLDLGEWRLPTTEGLRTTVHECKRHLDNLVAIERRVLESPGTPKHRSPEQSATARSNGPLHWVGQDTIGRIQDVLNRKGQVVLYGPPGTGKTYWAERAAKNLAALWNFGTPLEQLGPAERARLAENVPNGFVRFCLFHPSYGYEDFIEGFRPTLVEGALHFSLQDGVFKAICEEAARNPVNRFYLIVDEINRGDIPRIFGELLSLLDKPKRGSSALLPLSRQTFHVPQNVFVLGTMNTADRSIALLDTALRRRFGFIELPPDVTTLGDAVIEGIPLGPWLTALNRLIATHVGRDGRSLQVGHSYFLADERPVHDLAQFARVLQEDILPLLEEYCYNDWDTLERILGSGFVDVAERRLKLELFAAERQADLVQAVLACTPDVNASAIAVAADAASQDTDPDVDEDAEEEQETA